MSLDTAGLRVLTRAECLQLLSTVTIGRIALSHRAMPLILPVHFRLDDQRIVVHTPHGTTLHRCTDDVVVAFEAEGPAGAVEPRWSVVVHGIATHPQGFRQPLDARTARIEISVDELSGRELLDTSGPMAPMLTDALPRW
jgi:Pyridoxamine 5'-phosphate oxidase